MTDVHSKEIRSYNMSKIRGKDTKPEMLVRKFLFSKGLRYRLHVKKLPGTPDLVFAKKKTAVFINGCFWHGHTNCKYFVIPKSRTDWWKEKISRNAFNDEKHIKQLEDAGWKVINVWECDLKKGKRELTLASLYNCLVS